MIYQVNEIFQSIQGEGEWIGQGMAFIRLAGCNLNCPFCDTKHQSGLNMTLEEIYKSEAVQTQAHVCLTGGEPTIQPLGALVDALKAEGHTVHLETNGTRPIYHRIDWVTASPKTCIPPGDWDAIKVLCGPEGWQDLMAYYLEHAPDSTSLFLQPIEGFMPTAIDYVLRHPEVRLSPQLHKLINVK